MLLDLPVSVDRVENISGREKKVEVIRRRMQDLQKLTVRVIGNHTQDIRSVQ